LQITSCQPLAFVRVHQAPPRTVVTTSSCSLLPIYRPRKDERLSWPSWLTYSGRFTYISGHPSAVSRAQDSESSPVKDQRSAAEPRNQPRALFRTHGLESTLMQRCAHGSAPVGALPWASAPVVALPWAQPASD